jgi:hypothetical protein
MLSLRDCLDYCDLTDDDVALIAEHENIPDITAAQILCGMVQTPEGVLVLTRYLREVEERAHRAGHTAKAAQARQACARFMAILPLPD